MKRKIIIEIILHLVFWILTAYYFTNNSFLRYLSFDIKEEYYSLFLIIIVVYTNYFWLIPHIFTQKKILKYFLALLFLLLLITALEFSLLRDDIIKMTTNLENKLQDGILRWNYIGIFFRNILFVGFFTMFRIYRDAISAYKLLQEKTILEQQKLRTEINMVKSKVNSHFFFNTLNSIYALALVQSDKTADMVVSLSELMHYVVADSENEYVLLNKEIDFLQNYIALETARHQQLDVQFNVQGDTSQIKVPPMIFESFVNNAFKYTDNEGHGYIHINLECQSNNMLIFTCENNTRAITTNVRVQSTNKGLKNTNDRLRLYYNNKHELETYIGNGIYKVRLELNVK